MNLDWKQEFRTSLRNPNDIKKHFNSDMGENFPYPVFIPDTLSEKIKRDGKNSPMWNQFIPHNDERSSHGFLDPIGDQSHNKEKRIIHRYENRALIWVTNNCPVICRYCFRKNELYESSDLNTGTLEKVRRYLENEKQIEEVILTGGDPLVLDNEQLSKYFDIFKSIPSIKYVRIHSRTPVILPSRMDEELNHLFENYNDWFKTILVIHTNHSNEIDETFEKNISKFKIKLLAQTVLLKGVNDDVGTLSNLFKKLSSLDIQPYYLHHPDRAKGAMHFHLNLETGRKIYAKLQNKISGWMIPKYVIDLPEGGGKVPAYNPEQFEFSGKFIDRLSNSIDI